MFELQKTIIKANSLSLLYLVWVSILMGFMHCIVYANRLGLKKQGKSKKNCLLEIVFFFFNACMYFNMNAYWSKTVDVLKACRFLQERK